jgi:nitroreductase
VVFSDIDHVLSTTRAVRKRLDLDREVEPAVIAECLRLAAQAPTGGNIQNWRFVVVTDPTLRAAIGEYYRQGAEEYLATGLARARSDEQRRVARST